MKTVHGLYLFEGSSHSNTSIIEDDPDLDRMEMNETEKSCDKADSVEDSSMSETNPKFPSCNLCRVAFGRISDLNYQNRNMQFVRCLSELKT